MTGWRRFFGRADTIWGEICLLVTGLAWGSGLFVSGFYGVEDVGGVHFWYGRSAWGAAFLVICLARLYAIVHCLLWLRRATCLVMTCVWCLLFAQTGLSGAWLLTPAFTTAAMTLLNALVFLRLASGPAYIDSDGDGDG